MTKMATNGELNKAIKTLRDECMKHDTCPTCPMCDDCLECLVGQLPYKWETINGGNSDGEEPD